MYIRRKVFSVIEDENGEEKYFSTTEFINEETYLQKEFGLIQNATKGVKNLARKVGRDAQIFKTEMKVAAGKDLTNKELGQYAAKTKVRAQRYNNGKMSSLTKKVMDAQGGKEALNRSAEALSQKYKSGRGAVNLGFGLL